MLWIRLRCEMTMLHAALRETSPLPVLNTLICSNVFSCAHLKGFPVQLTKNTMVKSQDISVEAELVAGAL